MDPTGQFSVAEISLSGIIQATSPEDNVLIMPNDVLSVPRANLVYVIGEVKNAGQYPYRPGLTVQDAVAMAGGYTYRANTRTLYVRRTNAGGEDTVQTDSDRAPVLPGDNIRVPERYF